jgi:hypothetical protein
MLLCKWNSLQSFPSPVFVKVLSAFEVLIQSVEKQEDLPPNFEVEIDLSYFQLKVKMLQHFKFADPRQL